MRLKLGFTEFVHFFDEMANVAKENGEYQPSQFLTMIHQWHVLTLLGLDGKRCKNFMKMPDLKHINSNM